MGKKKKVTFVDPTLEQDEDDIGENNDEDGSSGDIYRDLYVPHAYYRELIAKGFENKFPSRLASSKPAYFHIDDPVTRSTTTFKYTAKATEYNIAVANALCASVTKDVFDDAIAANNERKDPESVATLLGQVQASMVVIEDMHRDRMIYLDLTSDPNSSFTTSPATSCATTSSQKLRTKEARPRATRCSMSISNTSSELQSSPHRRQPPSIIARPPQEQDMARGAPLVADK